MSSFASGYVKYINHLEQINDAASNPISMINEIEDAFHEHIKNIARNICEKHNEAKIVMLAGPSSSGKTTTAHFLAAYLDEFGKKSHVISLDDFFIGREKTPLLPNGKRDFESVKALDEEKIKECLLSIVTKGECVVPQYNFMLGKPDEVEHSYKFGENDIIIVEGLHALNPIFTQGLPEAALIKLYVSVKQSIKDANGEVMSPLDIRLMRRIVRDMKFRNTPPIQTFSMWPGVIEGENMYVRPYRMSADYTVNSVHIYEPCVFKQIVVPLLREIPNDSPYYKQARNLESRMMRFDPINDELVPDNSILREFLGKSIV